MEKKSEEKEIPTGLLSIVSTPIGHIDDITLRALRTIKKADAVVCEEFKPAATLLMKLGIDKELHELNEHTTPEDQAEIVMMLREGKHLALISDCGTPIIADPGSGILDAAVQHGITVEALPGASSPMTALVLSNFNTEKFVYAGFLARQPEVRVKEVELWMKQPYTTVFLETPYRIKPFLEAFATIAPNRMAFLGCNLTMPTESLHRGTLKELCEKFAEKKFKGEFVLVVQGDPNATDVVVPRVQSSEGDDSDRGSYSDRRPRSFGRDRASRPPRRDFGDDRRPPRRDDWKRDDTKEGQEGQGGERRDDRAPRRDDRGPRRDDRRGGFRDDRGPRRDDRGPRRDDRGPRRDNRRGGFRDDRGPRRDDRGPRRDDRGPRRDDRGPRRDDRGPRRDDRGPRRDDRGPRRDDRGPRRDDRGPRRDDRGPRRDDRRGGFRDDRGPRRDDRGPRRDDRGPRRDDRRGGFRDDRGPRRDDRRGGGDRRPQRGGSWDRRDDRAPRRDDRKDDLRGENSSSQD